MNSDLQTLFHPHHDQQDPEQVYLECLENELESNPEKYVFLKMKALYNTSFIGHIFFLKNKELNKDIKISTPFFHGIITSKERSITGKSQLGMIADRMLIMDKSLKNIDLTGEMINYYSKLFKKLDTLCLKDLSSFMETKINDFKNISRGGVLKNQKNLANLWFEPAEACPVFIYKDASKLDDFESSTWEQLEKKNIICNVIFVLQLHYKDNKMSLKLKPKLINILSNCEQVKLSSKHENWMEKNSIECFNNLKIFLKNNL